MSREKTVALLISIACVSGCSTREATEIMLTVDSDLVVGDDVSRREIDVVRVRVYRLIEDYEGPPPPVLHERRDDRAEMLDPGDLVRIDSYVYEHRWSNDFELGGEDGFLLPLEIGVAPENRDHSRTAYLEAVALRGNNVVVRTAVRTRFVAGRTVRVILWLSASCVGRECPPEMICREASCVPVEIDPMCLPSAHGDASIGPTGCMIDLPDAGLSCDPACATGQTCVSGRCITECAPACVLPQICIDGACMDENEDRDGDGIPVGLDCDDDDPLVGSSATRSCTNTCGTGTETCTDGVWGPCDAPCACTDGATRMRPCGNCGTRPQECQSNAWVDVGACMGEGVCSPSDTTSETRGCACGSESRDGTCTSSCTWSWGGWSGCPTCCECSGSATENRSVGSCGACGQGRQIETRTCDGCRWGGWSPSGCDESGLVCRPGECECGSFCGTGSWRCCNPSTCTWYSCGPKPSCS